MFTEILWHIVCEDLERKVKGITDLNALSESRIMESEKEIILQQILDQINSSQEILKSIFSEVIYFKEELSDKTEKICESESEYSPKSRGCYMADYVLDGRGIVVDVQFHWVEFD